MSKRSKCGKKKKGNYKKRSKNEETFNCNGKGCKKPIVLTRHMIDQRVGSCPHCGRNLNSLIRKIVRRRAG